jgi:hypothetical protein
MMSMKQHYREMVNFLDLPMQSTVGDGSTGYLAMQQDLLRNGGDTIESSLEDIQDLGRTIVRVTDALKV